MSSRYPARVYRRASKERLRQGDIAVAEFHQLRARTGDRPGPAGQDQVASDFPFLGEPTDFELRLPRPGESEEVRVVRVWRGFAVVLHQNCEIDFAHGDDSRVLIAPITTWDRWPEGSWKYLRENTIPGYFYLPPLSEEDARSLGLPRSWPEGVAVLASSTLSSIGLIKSRRQLSLTQAMLPHLQDCLGRFYGTRGFGGERELTAVIGRRVVQVQDTNQTVAGPSRLMKVYFGEDGSEPDERDDELTVAYWGVRP